MRIRDKLSTLSQNEDGNIAVITILGMTVMLAAIGVAIDTAGMTKSKAELQSAVDAGTLAASQVLSEKKKDVQEAAIIGVMNNSSTVDEKDIKVRVDDETVIVEASSRYENIFMGMFGRENPDINARAEAPRATEPPMDVALVLDTTDSMSGANLIALQDAVHDLLDAFDDSKASVRVSIVPYGEYVNIGLDKAGEPWLKSTKDSKFVPENNWTREVTVEVTPRVCTPTGNTITTPVYADGVITGYNTRDEQTCTGGDRVGTGTYESGTTPAYTINYEWGGCAGSRPDPHHLTPGASASNQIIGALHPVGDPGKVQCGQPITPLTDDFDDLRDAVDSLTTNGKTYLPSGLIWGWRTLDHQTPYTEGASRSGRFARVMIFMSDGGNVRSRNDEYHNGGDWRAGAQVAETLCSNIKDSDIALYTVSYDLPASGIWDEDPKLMMQRCATSPGLAFTATNAFELKASFKAIARSLLDVRLMR